MYIRAISSALPQQKYTSEEIESWTGCPVAFQKEKLGIVSRGFLSQEESGVSLAVEACKKLFKDNQNLKKEAVELLVFVTQTPDYGIPHNAALLQHALGLSCSCACFDIGLGCSGYVYALSIVKGFMLAEGLSNAVLVTCDPYSRIVGKHDKDTLPIFGDAATATWLASNYGVSIGKGHFGTDGSGAQHLIVRAGKAVKPYSCFFSDIDRDIPSEEFRLMMNGRAIINFVVKYVEPSITECLLKNTTSIDEINIFCFHQASRFMLETLIKYFKLPRQKVPICLEKTGNTVSSSIPLVLERLWSDLKGNKVLVSGFGVGFSWATNILTFPMELE